MQNGSRGGTANAPVTVAGGTKFKAQRRENPASTYAKEAFEFLIFSVAWRQGLRSKRWYPQVELRAKNRAKLRDQVRAVLAVRTRDQAAVAVVRKVNQITRGWAQAFQYGNSTPMFYNPQAFFRHRLRTVVVAEIQLHPRARQLLHRRPTGRTIPAEEQAAQSGLDAMNSAESNLKQRALS